MDRHEPLHDGFKMTKTKQALRFILHPVCKQSHSAIGCDPGLVSGAAQRVSLKGTNERPRHRSWGASFWMVPVISQQIYERTIRRELPSA